MTRFARAKGSKASNEKLPESATSWAEMKQELLNKSKEKEVEKERQVALQKRQENYDKFLQERQEEQEKDVQWAKFDDNQQQPRKRTINSGRLSNGNKKAKINSLDQSDEDSDDPSGQFSALKSQIDNVLNNQEAADDESDDEAPREEAISKKPPPKIIVKKAKTPQRKLKIVVNAENEAVTGPVKSPVKKQQKETEENKNATKLGNGVPKLGNGVPGQGKLAKKLEKRKKQKEKKIAKNQEVKEEDIKPETLSEADLKKIKKKKERRARQAEKRRQIREAKASSKNEEEQNGTDVAPVKTEGNTQEVSPVRQNGEASAPQKKSVSVGKKTISNNKPRKPRDTLEHSSRKPKSEKLFINGQTVEIDYVDGFPIKKEDADRIKQLRKEMISKGLPRTEINAALKLERRRAEKAFTRMKKNVCFKCRKSGHNLSECPELNKNQVVETSGTGICFKCGSAEHTHFECKVVKGLDYKFATCFICKEQGHIAKQCPDNQRGLYPKGGACKVCGDVTHLKKDCPKYQVQQAQLNNFSVATLGAGNPDEDDYLSNKNNNIVGGDKKTFNKIVKF